LLSKGEANSPNMVKYLTGSFLDKLLVGNSGEDHIYIFTPFMQNELPEYIELELDDIVPDKPKISVVDDNDTLIIGTVEPGALDG
jgi:hypothetical protein